MEHNLTLTYNDLVLSRFEGQGESQQKRNAVSALLGFLDFLKKDFTCVVGPEFLEDFAEGVNRYLLYCKSESTRYTKKSHLKHWQKFYTQQVQSITVSTEGHNFKSFVQQKLVSMGKNPWWLKQQTGSTNAYNWFMNFSNQYPSDRSKELVCAVSTLLGFEKKFLWDTFVYYPKTIQQPFKNAQTDYGAKLTELKKGKGRNCFLMPSPPTTADKTPALVFGEKGLVQYLYEKDCIVAVPLNVTKLENTPLSTLCFDKESNIFLNKKQHYYIKAIGGRSVPYKGSGYTIRQEIWDSSEMDHVRKEAEDLFHFKTDDVLPDGIYRSKDDIWTKDSDGVCGSFTHFVRSMMPFFGFLVTEKKLQLNDLTLKLALRPDYISDFMIFMSRRRGFLTSNVKGFLSDVRSLIKYYREYPEIGFPELTPELGKKKAKDYLEYITLKTSSSNFRISRNPEDQLRVLLDLEEPLAPFYEAVSVLKKQYAFVKREQPHLMWLNEIAKNIVLLLLILEKPIRSKNLSRLQFERNLYKKQDGRYELYIPAPEVKNKREIKKTLSEDLSQWIDIYRNEHYKKLNPDATSFVFISESEIKYNPRTISKVIGRLCLSLIGIEIKAHGFRHLRATAYLLRFPQDYVYVAELLNDDLKTVIKRYSHLKGRAASKNDDEHLKALAKKFEV